MTWLFANPLFAWLLPAAALPVIFHLFFKLKKRPRVFPTLMFFQQIDPKLSARRQIRQWLVLLLRVLFLLFLLLALARPQWLIGGGSGSVAVVCVIDNSGSMSGAPLKTAVEAARALAGHLEAKDTLGVVTLVDDPTVALPPGLDSDKAQIKAALDRIVATEATGDPAGALQRASALLETSSATRFEVHIFTDLQQTEWNRAVAATKPPRAGTALTVHRLASPYAKQPNVSLAAARLPAKRLLAERPLLLQVTLVNPSDVDANIRLNWADDADNKATVEVTVPRQSEKNVPLVLKPAAAGFHSVQTWIEGDGFEADNRAAVGFVCSEKSAVLFLGKPDEFGFLPLAIAPTGSGLVPVFGTAADLATAKPLLVVAPWEKAGELRSFLNQGGNVLAMPLGETGRSGLPAATGTGSPIAAGTPLLPEIHSLENQPKGAPIMIYRSTAVVFADLRDDTGRVAVRSKAYRFHPLSTPNEAEVVFGLDDGRALFTERRVGTGMLFVSGIGFDSTWSTLPLKGAFLAIAQGMALAHESATDSILSMVAGERLAIPATEIRSLAGSPLDWKGDGSQPPVFPRAGVYQAKAGSDVSHAAVRAAAREGVMKFVTGEQVPALAGLTYSVRPFEDIESFLDDAIKIGRGVDLFLPLLLLAILLLLLEAWLANPLPRKFGGTPVAQVKPVAEVVR